MIAKANDHHRAGLSLIFARDGLPCPCSGLYELSSYSTTKTTTRILYILTFGVPNIYLNELPTSPFLLQFFSATDPVQCLYQEAQQVYTGSATGNLPVDPCIQFQF